MIVCECLAPVPADAGDKDEVLDHAPVLAHAHVHLRQPETPHTAPQTHNQSQHRRTTSGASTAQSDACAQCCMS